MGLKNSGQSFQRLMNCVLDGLDSTFCYLDDILIYSKNEEEHLLEVERVLERLKENGLTINLKKRSGDCLRKLGGGHHQMSMLVNKGEGVKNLQNLFYVVCVWPLRRIPWKFVSLHPLIE